MELFEKCTSGQVKRMMSIMADSIPTHFPKKLMGDLIDKRLRPLLKELWQVEWGNFYNSLHEKFRLIESFHVKLDKDFSFKSYTQKESSRLLFSDFFDQNLVGSEEYPSPSETHNTRQANIVKVIKTTTLEDFFLFIGLTPGYLAGRDGIIQTFEQGSNRISNVLKKNEELIAPSKHYLHTVLRKISDNEDFIVEMNASGQLLEGQFLLYFSNVAWINTF